MPPVIANTSPVSLTLTSTRRTGWWLWGCALSVVGASMLFFFDPAQHGFYPRCLFYSATGLHCPGCGVLRGLHRLLHGHPLEAFRMNPLAFTLLPTMAGVCLWRKRLRANGLINEEFFTKPLWIWLLAAVTLTFWILRNVPLYPFSLLAPAP